jgi:hypothetical protein
MRGRASADKRRMGRLSILVLLLQVAGCTAGREATPVLRADAAKAAVVRAARRHYGSQLVLDQLACNRSADGTMTCSVSFAPRPSRPSHEICMVYDVTVDPAGRIELAPALGHGACYFAGGASGAIVAGQP